MILVIRIVGQAAIKKDVEETLRRLNMHRKLASTLISKDDDVKMGMLKKVAERVSYGEISDDLVKDIILKRGETLLGKKVAEKDIPSVIESIKKGEWKIKRFFRLHPPIGGFKKSTKVGAPKGILGENKDIAKLAGRML
jgi:large subunit ribosomal protein L30